MRPVSAGALLGEEESMKSGVVRWLMVAAVLLVMPAMAMAQEATLTGTVMRESSR